MIVPIAAAIVGITVAVTAAGLYSASAMACRTTEEYEDELGEVPLGGMDPAYTDLGIVDITYSEAEQRSRRRLAAQPVVAYSSSATLTPKR